MISDYPGRHWVGGKKTRWSNVMMRQLFGKMNEIEYRLRGSSGMGNAGMVWIE